MPEDFKQYSKKVEWGSYSILGRKYYKVNFLVSRENAKQRKMYYKLSPSRLILDQHEEMFRSFFFFNR